ncbi:hypothetical protein AU375_06433 [Methylobacterium radiotolerans]|jgi:mercuric ion transport protein|nr:hypothetical protein AU375_06433 [Methylobacterium radiotolerans]
MTVRTVTEPTEEPDRSTVSTGWLAGLGTLFGMGALAASSCCALPVALVGLGATGTVLGGLSLLTNLRPFLLGGGFLALLVAWGLLVRSRATACALHGPCTEPSSRWRTVVLLGSGTLLVGLALVWGPHIEPLLLRAMRG